MTSVEVKKVLSTLLRDPDNAKCGDCKVATHPRWASWSLGVFICIKCAGFHRSMGTHISKVKSVDLDTWTEEHLAAVLKYGNNKKFNEYYENKLGGGTYVPDQSKLGQFIRTKYELKKWVGDGPIADTNKDATKNPTATKTKPAVQSASPTTFASQKSAANISTDLNRDLHLTPVGTGGSSGQKSSTQESSFQRNNVYKPQDRPDLKKSILSLYANQKSSQSPSHSSLHLPNKNNNSSNSSFNSGGVIGGVSSNPWSLSQPAGETRTGSSLSLDDDLFKNVWS